jgi:arylsulfatase A-like enzyme
MIRVGRGAAVVLLSLLAACESTPVRESRPNLLFISVDTLRADHLGCYGYRLDTSPTIDRLAAAGVRFADATVQWPKTTPSMASMLIGKFPATTGVRFSPRVPVPAEQVTLAESLRSAGYATAAVVANPNVGRDLGFDQGFDRFVESWLAELRRKTGERKLKHSPWVAQQFTNATVVTDEAIGLLEGLSGDRPFFLWLHYIDPHGPYSPPRKYRPLFHGEHPRKTVPREEIPPYQLQIDPERGVMSDDLGFYAGQYDREIRYFDDQLARLLARLDALDLRDDTLIVLTADHGESLDEHGYYLEHGKAPFQPVAQVPLLFVLPGRVPSGRVVTEPVGLIDLVPTVLELLDVPKPPGVEGRSLVSSWQDGASSPYVFMEGGTERPTQLVVRKGRWKLTRFRSPEDRARFGRAAVELYDLARDPSESRDVRAEHPEVAGELEDALARWQASTSLAAPRATAEPARVDERTHQMLKGLGYVE